jgi:hypothetical protein
MCQAGKCGGCGGPGEPCCPGSGVQNEALCTDATSLCQNNGNGSVCARCGGPDQPCCTGNTCSDGGCCVTNPASGSYPYTRCVTSGQTCATTVGSMCANGSCGTCGGLGQPCCTSNYGTFCSAPGTACRTTGAVQVCVDSGMLRTCNVGF